MDFEKAIRPLGRFTPMLEKVPQAVRDAVFDIRISVDKPVLLCCGDREVTGGVYCCDLLSMVMGRAPTDGVWFTVMANQNTIVAALMADVACVVLTEGIRPDEAMLARAAAENIAVATADCPSYAAARRADDRITAG